MGKMAMPCTLPAPVFDSNGAMTAYSRGVSFGPPTMEQHIAAEVTKAIRRERSAYSYSAPAAQSSSTYAASDGGYGLGLATGIGLGSIL